jgi:ketosteroid isomerase-like protein
MTAESSEASVALVLECFAAVERRDEQRQRELFHPQAEFHWPPSLPYGGAPRRPGEPGDRPTYEEIWAPFQPTEAERRLDPRFVAARGDEVVVLWQQRGIDRDGNRFECPVLGLYKTRGGKLVRARMFYFDTTATGAFLERSASR